jgi:hypothetical protein
LNYNINNNIYNINNNIFDMNILNYKKNNNIYNINNSWNFFSFLLLIFFHYVKRK